MFSAGDESGGRSHSHGRHLWVMLLGCAAMLLGLGYVVRGGGGAGSLAWLFLLACPLMHVFMMFSHGRKRGTDGEETDDDCRH